MAIDPTALTCRCQRCGHNLWSERKGEWTLQNRILKLTPSGGIAARCPKCAADVSVAFLRLAEPRRPRMFVRRKEPTQAD
jgi:hypothetical protein